MLFRSPSCVSFVREGVVQRQADDHAVTLVDVYPAFQDSTEDLISGDLIHPNDAGYQVMADAVVAELHPAP